MNAASEVIFRDLHQRGQARLSAMREALALHQERPHQHVRILSSHFPLGPASDALAAAAPARGGCIYYVRANSDADAALCWDAFRAARHRERDRPQRDRKKFAKVNKPGSRYLYVGSCTHHMPRDRLNEHLGRRPGTFSLRLAEWFPPLDIGIDFVFNLYQDTDPALVKILEATLWDELQPMFGQNSRR